MDSCKATTKAGKACRAAPLKGQDVCLAHADAKTREQTGFVADNGKQGRKKRPTEIEMYEKVWRENTKDIEEALKRGITATRHVVVGNGPSAHVEEVPDVPTQLKAVEIFTDRLVGRPTQAVEITGDEGGPIQFEGIRPDAYWHQGVAKVLAETGAHGADPDQDQ
jgi:hypothetical protein